MGKFSGIIEEVRTEDDKTRARAAGLTAPAVDPDAMGRAMRVADQRGLPVGVVADNLPDYDQQQQLDSLGDAAAVSPVLGRWLGDPNHAALSKDDTGVLSNIGLKMASGLLRDLPRLPGMAIPTQVLGAFLPEPKEDDAGPQMQAGPQPSWFSELVGTYQQGWEQGKQANIITVDSLPGGPKRVDPATGRVMDHDYPALSAAVADYGRRAEAAEVMSSETKAQFERIAEADSTGQWLPAAKAWATSPRAVMSVVAQSLGSQTPQLGLSMAMPASAILRGIIGGGGSFTAEQGMTVLDSMQDVGVDTSDAAAVSSFMRDPKKMQAARERALKRGVAVGLFDGLSAGFAGRLLANARRSTVSIGSRVLGEGAVQMAAGMAGETAGQLAADGKISSRSDIIAEGIAEFPTFLAEGRGSIARARRNAMSNADRFDASQEQRSITDLVNLASQSKTRERAAGRFESLIRDMTGEGEDTIYLSADGAQRLFQSANDGSLDGLVDAESLREAIASGGEVAIPLERYATMVSPEAHASVADQVRLQPGGQHDLPAVSPEEIQAAIAEGLAEAQQQEARENGPAGQVYDDVYGQLLSKQDEKLARQNASVVQSVYRNLGERVGVDAWELYQQFKINIPGGAPDTRGAARGIDIDVDPYLDALRSGKLPSDADIYGQSLASALHAAGGLRDSGGELANMDAAKQRPGLVNNLAGMTLDDALVWAHQEGFITEAPTNQQEGDYDADAPDINSLLDLLAQDLGGNPVFRPAAMNSERAAFRDNASALQDELDQRGIDLDQADNATARQALGYGRTLNQAPAPAVEQIQTPEFQAWFGDSKVVDESGAPAVVYHGTKDTFGEFSGPAWFAEDSRLAHGFIGGGRRSQAKATDGSQILPVYLSISNPLDLSGSSIKASMTPRKLFEKAGIDEGGIKAALDSMAADTEQKLRDGLESSGFSAEEIARSIERSRAFSSEERERESPVWMLLDDPAVISALQSAGVDGVKARESMVINRKWMEGGRLNRKANEDVDSVTWLSFRPEQVKSATGNAGSFDQNDPRIDYAVRDLVAGPSGRPESEATRALVDQAVADGDLAKMLRGIAAQDGIDADQAALANRLAEITPDLNVTMVPAPANASAAGVFDNTTNEIWIHQAVPSVVLHETLHGVTSAMMTSPVLRKANPAVAKAVAEFNDLLASARVFAAAADIDAMPAGIRDILKAEGGPLSNIKELLTYGMTDSRFQRWLATVPAPGDRAAERTAWQWFKDAIAGMLGVTGQERSALDALIESTSDLVDFAQANPQAVNFAQMSEASRLGGPRQDAAALNQGGENPRGSVTFGGESGARVFNIELLKGMDASTFMHEMGHVYLEVLNDLATREGAPDQIRADMATLDSWLGREAGAEFTVDQHEQFARGFEAYLREGKAPSAALCRTFAAFKVWLTALYRSVRSLNVELTDNVRDVMDRIVASDAEIEEAREAQYQGPLIADAMAVGMTFEQLQEYNAAVDAARADAEAAVAAEVLLAERREQQAWYNREKRAVHAQVLEDLRNTPVYRAQRLLRNGKLPDGEIAPDELRMKLSKDDLLDRFGQSFLRNLTGMYAVEGGVRSDEVAAVYGFGSGRELVDALVNAPKLMDAVASETDARMQQRHPDPMTDGTLPDRAMMAVHRDRQADVMLREIRALEQHVGGRQVSQSAVIKGMAKQIIADKKLRNLQPATYRSGEAKAGREAFAAAAKQDWPAALAARRRQLLNFELFREAVRARDGAARDAKFLSKFSTTKVRARLGKAGFDYLDQIDALLDRFDFRKISDKAADRRSSLATWIQMQEQKGIDVNLPMKITDEAFSIPFREMTVSDLSDLRDTVQSIDHMARLKGKLLLAGEQRDAAEIDIAMAASIRDSHKVRAVTTGDRTNGDKIRQAFMQGRVLQATATDMARELDGFKDQGAVWMNTVGVMRDAVNNRLNPALQQAQDDLAKVYVKHYTKEEIRAFADREPLPEVDGDLWSKGRLLGLALNWGNEGNREAILSQAKARLSPEQANSLLARLDARDWAFVEEVWGLIDSMWPAIAEAQKRRTGLVPQKVEASGFTIRTSDGKLLKVPGGYYPLKYEQDSVKTMREEIEDFYNSIRTGKTAKASTRNGFTIERTGSGGRTVRLDTGVIQQHQRDVLRDVHLGDAVNYVHKVLDGSDFKAAIDATGTQEYRQALEVWLKDAAAGEMAPRVWHERAMRSARQNFTAAVLTFKPVSALMQITGFIPTSRILGSGRTLSAISQFTNKPRAMSRYVRGASPYMDTRLRTHIEAVQSVMDAEAGQFSSRKAAMIRFGYWMIGRVQGLVDTVTWMAAEQAGMEKFGNNVDRARAYADDVVARSQGSGEFIDKSPLQRGTLGDNVRQTEFIKGTTALQGYMIAKGNMVYEMTSKTNFKDPRQAMKWAADMIMIFTVEGMISAAITLRLPGDDDDDGSRLDDLAEFALKDTLSSIFGSFPGGGLFVDQAKGYDSSGVVGNAFRSYVDLVEQLTPGKDGETQIDKGVIKAAVTAAGVTMGLPSAQVNKTIDAIEARRDGRDVSPYEYLTGPKKEPK